MTDLPIHRTRELTKDEKLAETGKLTRAYRAWCREQLNEALAGAHGATVAELMALLDRLELNSAATLLAAAWASANARAAAISSESPGNG
jgi:hypothetical protein